MFFQHNAGVESILIGDSGTLFTASRDSTIRRWVHDAMRDVMHTLPCTDTNSVTIVQMGCFRKCSSMHRNI